VKRTQRKRVLFVAGNARSLVANRGDLIEAMLQRGHHVSAAVPSEDYLDKVERLGADIYRFNLGRKGLNPLRDLAMMFRLRGLMQQAEPDMVFTYTIKPVVWGTFAARLAGVKECYAMITGLGAVFAEPTTPKGRVLRSAASTLYRSGLSGSRKVFFQNPDDLQDFVAMGVLKNPGKALRVNGSGVNLQHYTRQPLPSGETVFLFIGRMLRDKGIMEFCAAAREVRKRYPKARFVAVGPHDPALMQAVSHSDFTAWKREGIVEFVGSVDDVRPYLAACTVFVLPSYYREGIPRSALESLATGRAVITANTPGCRETVRDGENGFLVPPRDPAALSRAMIKFCEDESLARRMGEASFQRAVQEFDVRLVNRLILEAMGLQ
jgi:glycosyltransferase involved in cell wall biosynthesis